jgi:hypothetical protein
MVWCMCVLMLAVYAALSCRGSAEGSTASMPLVLADNRHLLDKQTSKSGPSR